MKRILLIIGTLFVSQTFAAEPTFCSSPTMADQSGCTSTCAAIAAAGSYTLSSGNYADCEAKVTKKTVKLYKLEIGKTEIGNESRCTIWEGDDIVVDLGGSSTGGISSKFPLSLKNCTSDITYDAFYATASRYEQFAAESVFPDGSGKVARTTSTFAGKDTAHSNTLSDWRDTDFSDTSKFYMTPSGWSSSSYKKLGTALSDTDLTDASNALMEWDELKTSSTWGTDTTTRPGFMCEASDSNDCTAEVIGQSDRYTSIIPSDAIIGFPLTLKKGDDTFDLEFVRFASERGTNKYKGVQFLWYNDGGTLKYAGGSTTSDGGYFVVTNVRSVDGL